MLAQYEYPTGCRQSCPPQSLALVIRAAWVLYGEGNVNGPRAGRNAWICPEDNLGRRPASVADTMNPPGAPCALTDFTPPNPQTRPMATPNDSVRRVIEDTRTSWPAGTPVPTVGSAASKRRLVSGIPESPAANDRRETTAGLDTNSTDELGPF